MDSKEELADYVKDMFKMVWIDAQDERNNKDMLTICTSATEMIMRRLETGATRHSLTLLDELLQFTMHEQSTYMNPRVMVEPDFTDGVSQGKNQAYGKLLQFITTKRQALKDDSV